MENGITEINGTILINTSKKTVVDCKGNTELGEVIVDISCPACIHT